MGDVRPSPSPCTFLVAVIPHVELNLPLSIAFRIPAASCGIYSLKPGTGRISMSGVRGACPSSRGDPFGNRLGFLCQQIEALESAC